MGNERVFSMKFSKVYPLYVAKATKKGRSREEVDEIIQWLTGYGQDELATLIEEEWDIRKFIESAPAPNPSRNLIKGVVCGVRVEEIEEHLMRELRYLDKLIDELARGKAMEKILLRLSMVALVQ